MSRILLLAWRYITFHKIKTAILIICITLTAFLPVALHFLVERFQTQLMKRAETTPLIVGAKGSRFDFVLHTLYFETEIQESISLQPIKITVYLVLWTSEIYIEPGHIQELMEEFTHVEKVYERVFQQDSYNSVPKSR